MATAKYSQVHRTRQQLRAMVMHLLYVRDLRCAISSSCNFTQRCCGTRQVRLNSRCSLAKPFAVKAQFFLMRQASALCKVCILRKTLHHETWWHRRSVRVWRKRQQALMTTCFLTPRVLRISKNAFHSLPRLVVQLALTR